MEDLVMNANMYQFYKNKKVFVTGHTGFKGSWFISWLYLAGAKIKGYALAPENERSLFTTVSRCVDVESVIADIRDKEKLLQEIVAFQPEFIFHFAAQPLVRRSYEIPAETFSINTIGTANLLECINALEGKCTIIIITTDKVYENKGTDHFYSETDILGGYDPYSASKACAEIVVNCFRDSFFNPATYNIHQKAVASVRTGNVIGGGDNSKDRIIPDIVLSLASNEPVKVRNPHAIRPWQYVLDPLSGYLILGILLDKEPGKFSGAYNFGPDENNHLTVKELVELAIECWGTGVWIDTSGEKEPHEMQLLKLETSKAINELKWRPKLSSREAIEWTIDWYKQSDNNRWKYTLDQIKNYQER